MAKPYFIVFSSPDELLANGLEVFTPESLGHECPVCLETWHSDPSEPVRTLCGHEFHRDCLASWVKTGKGNRGTCPTCLDVLCERVGASTSENDASITPSDQVVDAAALLVNIGHIQFEEDAIITSSSATWNNHVQQHACFDADASDVNWPELIVEALVNRRKVVKSSMDPWRLVTTDDFEDVKTIVVSLMQCAEEAGVDVSVIRDILAILGEYEENSDTRNVEDVFEDIGLQDLLGSYKSDDESMEWLKERQSSEDAQSFRDFAKYNKLEEFGGLWLSLPPTTQEVHRARTSRWSMSSEESEGYVAENTTPGRGTNALQKSARSKTKSIMSRFQRSLSITHRRPSTPAMVSKDVHVQVVPNSTCLWYFYDVMSVEYGARTTTFTSYGNITLQVMNEAVEIKVESGGTVVLAWTAFEELGDNPAATVTIPPGRVYEIRDVENVRGESEQHGTTIIEAAKTLLRVDGPHICRWSHTKKIVIVQNDIAYPLGHADKS
ncbi:hypothetical protein P153DRAFT_383324 [Dothidotthia symphoricarpi CBS 119687]|uniref:RING-type domain-containing protein n=1 Tax=Dothidotthia symphoricarpi CBS 119687 TaxID=1392245 RepID=A0A6A6AKF7_9PLEO|nr:uncharacterized protein P153DRAFT_383324 [Dothidotthia symphoricarpi CBS 119687]KAF2132442.1 hypothetical protein P153DRAFT_383324 [Dothidotthia symphoricarpi CBS 119687]